ncbi:MAG TPA: enoyl-CoA hydratase-related protein [Candidatus Kryptonia bacterium]
MGQRIGYEVKGKVAYLTMSRPEKRNALDDEAIREMTEFLAEAESDRKVRVIAIRGEGSSFSAGADLEYLLRLSRNTPPSNFQESSALKDLLLNIYKSKKLTCAIVRGPALAGAFGIVLACDLVMASDTARFGFTEVKIGFVPAIVLNFALRKLRESDVRRLVLTGDIIDCAEAVKIGITSDAIPDRDLDRITETFFGDFVSGTSSKAVALTKEILSRVRELNLNEALRFSTKMNVVARATDDFQKGVNSFLKKEKPRWE